MATKDKVVFGATRYPRFDSGDVFYHLAIAALPFILLAVNNSWIFPGGASIDRWVYSGFHLHLPELLRALGNTYYASRVPWTVPGWFLHSIFNDERALYVLHFTMFYLAEFSLYYTIRTVFASSAAAFATALLLGTQSYFLFAIGWDYVDGCLIACLLASFAALSSAAIQRNWRIAAILWGVAMTTTVSVYILLVLFVPIEVGMFLLLNRFGRRRSVFAVAALVVVGGVVGTCGFGLINWLVGGKFLYLLAQIVVLPGLAANRFDDYLPLAEWVWKAPWLLLPTISFIFSCLFVSLHHRSVFKKIRAPVATLDWEAALYVCCLTDIGASLIFAGLEVDHFDVLQEYFRANALLPFAVLPIGGALATMANSPLRVRAIAFQIALSVIALAPWLLATFAVPGIGFVFPRKDLFQGSPILVIAWIVAGLLLLWFVARRPYRRGGAAILIAFFSVISLGAPSRLLAFPPDPVYKQRTLVVFDASRAVARYNPDAQARFWFDASAPDGDLFENVASTYLHGFRLVNTEFPKLVTADGRRGSVSPGQRIILLAATGDPIPLANAAVADQNLSFEKVAEIAISRPGVAFTIYVTDVKAGPPAQP